MQKRSTAQKRAIFSALQSRRDHPSATRLYEDLKATYPTLSKATVYRVLKNAADEGEILRLHTGTEDHFDATIAPHLHLVCTTCGSITDAPLPSDLLPNLSGATGFVLAEEHAELYGTCCSCFGK